MDGKYKSGWRYRAALARRTVLRQIIRSLVRWEPIDNPVAGYTIIIGCASRLADMLESNLAMLARQDLTNLDRILLVFDRQRTGVPASIEQRVRSRFPSLPIEFLYYSKVQDAMLSRIGLPWAYSWLSWCKGIAAGRTQYAFLHDFDAMLIRQDIVEERYEEIRRQGAQWCGIQYYNSNGITRQDKLVTTFEMMFDQALVRSRFSPIDLFNKVGICGGKSVDFDTFLYAQTVAGQGCVVPIDERDMVHPSQVIHQFTELTHRRRYVPPAANNLLVIPYFLYLADRPQSMLALTEDLSRASGNVVPFFGNAMDLSMLSRVHFDWIRKQANTLELAVAGAMRDEVKNYFNAIGSFLSARSATTDISADVEPALLGERAA